ncbi:phytanoyl-CoA dioxygenase family protein [Trinickia violacea]|nr:phytanoyl-CoA dioxygenase family protein [Trinickia violacea]
MNINSVAPLIEQCTTTDGSRFKLDRAVAAFRQFGKNLHADDIAHVTLQRQAMRLSEQSVSAIAKRMDVEGYMHYQPAPDIRRALDIAKMRDVVVSLARAKIPTVFAFVYDEFWLTYWEFHNVIKAALGQREFFLLPDFWVWHVDAKEGEAGWAIHRDAGARSLLSDRETGAVSAWIPLVDVNTVTGCVMVVPKERDPDFGTDRVSQITFDVRDIRALPGCAGDLMLWDQALLHWGSRGSVFSETPRISMSIGIQVASLSPLNLPLLKPDVLPSVGLRLEMVAKQILQYSRHAAVAPEWCDVARVIFASGLSGITYELPPDWRLST